MGKPLFMLLIAIGSAGLYAQTPEPPKPADYSDTREAKRALKLQANKVRNDARMDHNLLIGAGVLMGMETPFLKQADPAITSFGLGLSLAYRTHFREKLGYKLESKFTLAETFISATRDTAGKPAVATNVFSGFTGYKGQTVLINGGGALVFGPFGRVAIEPGIGVSWVRHSLDSISLTGQAGNIRIPMKRSFLSVNQSIAATLFLGKHDEYNLTGGETGGFDVAAPGDALIQLYLAAAYAFRFPKG